MALGYLSVGNGSAVENVSFEFTLDAETLSEQNAPPETVSLDSGESRDVSLSVTFDDPGEYDHHRSCRPLVPERRDDGVNSCSPPASLYHKLSLR